jgi:hypothetical protein
MAASKGMGAQTKAGITSILGGIGNGWAKRGLYEWFEHSALVGLMFVISLISLFAFCVTIAQLFADAGFRRNFYGQGGFVGHLSIQTVLILLEFNHSIFVVLTQRTGAIQVRRAHRHAGRRSQNDANGFWLCYRPGLARARWALAVPRRVVLASSRRRSSAARNPDKATAVSWRSLGTQVAAAAFPTQVAVKEAPSWVEQPGSSTLLTQVAKVRGVHALDLVPDQPRHCPSDAAPLVASTRIRSNALGRA